MPTTRSSPRRAVQAFAALAAAVALTGAAPAVAQIRYATGQNVVPVFEGWERRPDGSFDMVFGYMNRNYEEEIDLPIGADNRLEPGGDDQGQPTHFYPRRQQFVFKVRVPADWGNKDLVWTLHVRGRTERAYASLLPFWELGPLVYSENRGGITQIGPAPEPNEAPTISLVSAVPAELVAGQPLALTVRVEDDGRPVGRERPNPGTPGATTARRPSPAGPRRESPLTQAVVRLDPGVSLGVVWVVYRGSTDGVTIEPSSADVVDGQASVTATFRRPGAYTLRGYADDSVYVTPIDVPIVVSAP